jgi:hypothetical protein
VENYFTLAAKESGFAFGAMERDAAREEDQFTGSAKNPCEKFGDRGRVLSRQSVT